MNLKGIEVSKEEIRAFQKVFPSTQASALLDKILMAMVVDIEGKLHDPKWSDTNLRVFQGMSLSLKELDDQIRFFCNVDMEKLEETEEAKEDEVEEGADVRF